MKHCLVAFLGAISVARSATDKANSVKSDFFEKWREDRTLEKGENIRLTSDQTASSVQQKVATKLGSKFVGVAVNIRNQSPFKLGQPKTWARCGYQVYDS